MTLEARVLGDTAVRARADGCEIDVRLPWYRSLPLSCIEDIQLSIDGAAVLRSNLAAVVAGQPLPLDRLESLADEEWFVQDPLTIVCRHAPPLISGTRVTVELTVQLRIPYIIVGPQAALVRQTRVSRTVIVQ